MGEEVEGGTPDGGTPGGGTLDGGTLDGGTLDGGTPTANEELRRLASELVDESRRLRERSDQLLEKAQTLSRIIDDGKKGKRGAGGTTGRA